MSTADRLLELEHGLWMGDAATYRELLADDAVMAFPDPTGVLDRERILASVAGSPRWASVDITEPVVQPIHAGSWLVVYRVVARHAGEDRLYAAIASSIYVARDGDWLILFHQQTPVAPPPVS